MKSILMDANLTLGIDEAGIGPVFGPLIVSGVLVDTSCLTDLIRMGVKDSKKFGSGLAAHRKRIKTWKCSQHHIIRQQQVIITAEDLDAGSMYDLHLKAVRKILNSLLWTRVSKVYIEQLGGLGRSGFFSRLGFWHSGFVYDKKADEKYPQVSLASIKAKILRDEIIIKMCRNAGSEYVSGYPNKNTESFLRKFFKLNSCLPPGTRKSRKWDPIIELAAKENPETKHK